MNENKSILLIPPRDASNDERGAFFESVMADVFTRFQWRVTQRVRVTGMEIDLLCKHRHTDEVALVQCKFTTDAIGAPMLYQHFGNAAVHDATHAYFVSASAPGKEARGTIELMKKKRKPRFAFIGPADLVETFIASGYAASPIHPPPAEAVVASYLVIAPGTPRFWLHEVAVGPSTNILVLDSRGLVTVQLARSVLREQERFSDLQITSAEPGADPPPGIAATQHPQESIGLVPMADAYDDYRPCRPADFVGRTQLVRSIVSFLAAVRDGESTTRVMSLTGPSGFGKSSILLKLTDRLRVKAHRNHMFCVPIDTRSARGRGFVSTAISFAVEKAHAEGFLRTQRVSLPVDPPYRDCPDFRSLLDELSERNKVLVVFFDQFEEILAKDDLRGVFDVVRKFAQEAHSEQSNLVLGFSWRTGIVLAEDNPAYHAWHTMSDLRRQFDVDRFTDSETSELIRQFEDSASASAKIILPLRKRLVEQTQGYPWLAKKLLIHVFREIARGNPDVALLHGRLNVKALFDEDIGSMSASEHQCIRYIASNSPADVGDVVERFGRDTLDALVGKRLAIRTAGRLAVYWDIFRDYLSLGAVPALNWSWFPISTASAAMEIFAQLAEVDAADSRLLAQRTGYREGTIGNALSDLQNLALIRRGADGRYSVVDELLGQVEGEYGLAKFVSLRLSEHVVVARIAEIVRENEVLPQSDFTAMVRAAAVARADKSEGYVTSLLAWLVFAGYLEFEHDIIRRPLGRGAQFGIVVSGRQERLGFQASAQPKHVVDAAMSLAEGPQPRAAFPRNALQDLIAMQIAHYAGSMIEPAPRLLGLRDRTEVERLVSQRAQSSPFMRAYELVRGKAASLEDEGKQVGGLLARRWSAGSARRYAGGARTWSAALEEWRRRGRPRAAPVQK